ncbi:MAG: NUDIX domain-containing protein [Firmicutes bacterium]|nr:NUDIX domain-containing protein [Bacillota bacterium]
MERILIDGHEKSCGAVVFTETEDGIRYLIVRGTSGNYSFPKGHIEANETEHETAAREIFEETGLRPVFLDGFRKTEEYPVRKNGLTKVVVYFLARFGGEEVVPHDEEVCGFWLMPFDEAYKTLRRESAREILKAADAFLRDRQDGDK